MAVRGKGTSLRSGTSAPQAAPPDAGGAVFYELRLYVAGQTPRSTAAIANMRALCDARLAESYSLEVIDLMRSPHLASRDRVVAIPTLVRLAPLPRVRVIGDMSDAQRVLARVVCPATVEAP